MLAFIGSYALNQVLGREVRRPKDFDLVGELDEALAYIKQYGFAIKASYPLSGDKWVVKTTAHIWEIELVWPGNQAEELLALINADPNTEYISAGECVASRDVLYMLKMSHRYRKNSPHFLKTMQDIKVLRGAGAKIRDDQYDFFKRREAKTYDYPHPKLDVSKAEFFKGDGIEYVYDHDSIHEAVKQSARPAYLNFKKTDKDVMTDKKLFFEGISESFRLFAVLEEAYVLALERSIIPHPGVLTPKQAFDKALMKVCTSITSGWFREYAWEHYDEVQALYKNDYTGRFYEAITKGIVKRI